MLHVLVALALPEGLSALQMTVFLLNPLVLNCCIRNSCDGSRLIESDYIPLGLHDAGILALVLANA